MAKRGENIYLRKDGRYEGRYAKGRKPDGKIKYGCVYGYTADEVRQKLRSAKGEQAYADESGVVRFSDFIVRWLEETVRHRTKESSFYQYHLRARSHLIPAFGELPLSEITADKIQRFITELFEKELSRSTIDGIFTTLSKALQDASKLSLINGEPWRIATLPKKKPKAYAQTLTWREQYRLVIAAGQAGHGVELSVLLALYAGLGIGEICALHWRDVDFASGTLLVSNTVQRVNNCGDESKPCVIETPKKGSRARRRVPLPQGLLEKLRDYGAGMPQDFYIISGSGKPFEPRYLSNLFDSARRETGILVSYRTLKRTYAAQCIENNCGVDILSQLLGHADSEVTRHMQSYSAIEHGRRVIEDVWSTGFAHEKRE